MPPQAAGRVLRPALRASAPTLKATSVVRFDHRAIARRGTLVRGEHAMSTPRGRSTDPVFRTAAWFYLVPRALTFMLVLAVIALASFLVLIPLVEQLIERFGR